MSLAKYRQAALIAQNALKFVVQELHTELGEKSIGEICRKTDLFILDQTRRCYTKIEEKGIARPTEICRNDIAKGLAPEESDKFQGGVINEFDVVKVSLGVHIDGYSVLAGHTVIVSSTAVTEPFTGVNADAVIGAYMATEAVIGLLSGTLSENSSMHGALNGAPVTGTLIKQLVEDIAKTYNLRVVPGSQVRRIKRFVVGQSTVEDRMPSVQWVPEYEPTDTETFLTDDSENFVVSADKTYLIDIQMAPAVAEHGFVKLNEVTMVGTTAIMPAIYTRNHTINYSLRTNAGRLLLGAVDNKLSVFPFKLSYLETEKDVNKLKLGLKECLQRHLLQADKIYRASFCSDKRGKVQQAITTAREVATVSLVSGAKSDSAYPELHRFSGGRAFPPSWTHSVYKLPEGLAASALQVRINGDPSFKYIEAKPAARVQTAQPAAPADSMEIEM